MIANFSEWALHLNLLEFLQCNHTFGKSINSGEFEFVPRCRTNRAKADDNGQNVINDTVEEEICTNSMKRHQGNNEINVQQDIYFSSRAHSFHPSAPISGAKPRLDFVFALFADEYDLKLTLCQMVFEEWDQEVS